VLNALWLDAQELNGNGQLYREISLAATATAGATAVPPTLYVRIGLAAHVTSTISQSAALTRRAGMSAAITPRATASNFMAPRVSLRSAVFPHVQGLFGASFAQHLAATATAGATGIVGIGAKNMAATRTGGATAVAPVLTRTRMLAAHVTSAITQGSPTNIRVTRNAFAHAYPGASGSAEMDWKVGSVQYRGLGAIAKPGASAGVAIDPKKFFAATLHLGATASAPPPQRTMALTGAPDLAGAIAVFGPLQAKQFLGAHATAGAVQSAQLYRTVTFAVSPIAVTVFTHIPPILQYTTFLSAVAAVTVNAQSPKLNMFRGLAAHVTVQATTGAQINNTNPKFYAYAYPQVNAADSMTVKPGVLLAAHGFAGATALATARFKISLFATANVRVTANVSGYFTRVFFAGGRTLSIVSATARMSVNLFDPEPDFRTYLLEPDDWSNLVDAEDWTLNVTDDAFA
jgi:hypothetical protein